MNNIDYLFRVKHLFLFTLLFVSLTGCNKSHATREMDTTIEINARQSESIVLATCIENITVQSDNKMIYTVSRFEVEEVIKGQVDDSIISIKLPGGRKGDMKINVPDRPEFIEEEEVILLLGPKTQEGHYILQSLNEAVYRVYYDNESEVRYVHSNVDGMTVYNSKTGDQLDRDSKVTLENFIFSLKRLIQK